MRRITHITATAPEGRKTPIHASDGTEPGGGVLYGEHGVVIRVRLSQTTRRSIARGDLIPCNMDGAPVESVELASAPRDLPGGKVVLPSRMQSAAAAMAESITPAKVDDLAEAMEIAAGALKPGKETP